jgi:hypothetical protein
MAKMRLVASVLLALPLIVFGSNYFLGFMSIPEQDAANAGLDLLQAMRDGGLMGPVAASHVVIGVLLLIPRSRFLGAMLQLPISLGIVAFHGSMMPEGLGVAFFLLVTNVMALAEKSKIQGVMG